MGFLLLDASTHGDRMAMDARPVSTSAMNDVASDKEVGQLRKRLERLELALNVIVDAIVWLDEQGVVQWCSPPFRRLIGKPEADIVGANLIELLPLRQHGRKLRATAHPVRLALDGQPNAVGSYEFRVGERTLVLEVMVALVQVSKQERNAVVAIRNITESKRAEEQIKQLAEAATTAAEKERKRAAELHKAYQELKGTQALLVQAEKMAAIGQLASGVAHEVKNPLGIILQGVNYLEAKISPEQTQQVEVLKMLKEAVERADRIIRDLLNFSRLSPLDFQPRSMDAVLETSLGLVEKQLTLKDIKMTRAFAPDLPRVLLDENQMKHVLINIILNAVQAMPQGGELTFRIATKPLTPDAHGAKRKAGDVFRFGQQALVCDIADTGTGIPPEVLSKVFEPFFTTKPAGVGTGLGLAICRAIVERHRGVIEITSEQGRGTTVTITLPVPDGAVAGV